jgi:hypothetical protein
MIPSSPISSPISHTKDFIQTNVFPLDDEETIHAHRWDNSDEDTRMGPG